MKPAKKNIPSPEVVSPGEPWYSPGLLQQHSEIFALMVRGIKEYAIFFIDVNGYVKTWNEGARAIKWYEPGEILDNHIAAFYTKTDVEKGVVQANLAKARERGYYECEGWRVRKGGSLFWANITFTAIYESDGSLLGFSKVTHDITRQKRNEAKISHQANLIDKTSDAIYSLDASHHILSWNKAAQTVYGYEAAEVLLKPVEEITRTELSDTMRLEINTELKEKKFWNGELQQRRKDGGLFWVFISVSISVDNKNEIDEFVCIARDITAQKRAEEESMAMRKKIESLVREKLNESIKEVADYKYALDKSSIVTMTDANGIIIYVNDNFCAVSKYSPGEVIGKDHRIVNSGYHPADFMHQLWNTIKRGNVWKGEIRNKAKDGTLYWVDTTIIPFIDETGKPYQYLSIRSSITEKKLAETALVLLNEQLEERVKQRTKLLEEANKELESFSYSVSHDLRAPLRAIIGYSKIVQEDYSAMLDDEGNRLFNEIVTNAKMMGQLIDDLLMFSRLGRKALNIAEIDMQQLVQNCVQELMPERGKYMFDIKDLPPCPGDISMVKQVWLNLIGNAVKYSSKTAHPVITIGGKAEARVVTYFVKDNGVGFDMKYAHKLFGVFQRLHRNDEFEGTGVGLALVKRIISKHLGNIWAESEQGRGATFYFSLPAKISI
ncbi:MAG TPA: PAS domain S-box protein [Chitinophagaceae bacterium]|nr:PAS domain S-box protein [Chitinophagaceae bacterium]